MSRLYMHTKSDVRGGKGKGASERAEIQVNFGSAGDSRLAVKVTVIWKKGEDRPTAFVEVGACKLGGYKL